MSVKLGPMYVIRNATTILGITPASATVDTQSAKMDSPAMVCYKIEGWSLLS